MNPVRYNSVAELNTSTWIWRIKVRLTRMWEYNTPQSRNIDMILLDESSAHIHARVPSRIVDNFINILGEGKLYDIQYFGVGVVNHNYRVVPHPFTVYFRQDTIVRELTPEVEVFPKYKFEFCDFGDIKNKSGQIKYLTDVVGKCTRISEVAMVEKNDGDVVEKRDVEITDISNDVLAITYWAEKAREIPQPTDAITSPQIYVITSTTVTSFRGVYHLCSTNATKTYLNLDIPEVHLLQSRLDAPSTVQIMPTTTGSVSREEKMAENRKTIAELCASLKNMSSQGSSFTCNATIKTVLTEHGWSYMSCGTCNRKAGKRGETMWCNRCEKEITSPIPRYRLQLEVEDATGTAEFVAFDKEGRFLLHKPASRVCTTQMQNTSQYNIQEQFDDLCGRSFVFQLKLSEYDIRQADFHKDRKIFTVSKIFQEERLRDTPNAQRIADIRGKRVLEENAEMPTRMPVQRKLCIEEPLP